KAIRATIRSWRLAATRNNQSLEDLARLVNPSVSGWVNYYGRFYRSALTPVLRHLERALIRWVCRKYKRFRGHVTNAAHWLGRVARRDPHLFVLWQIGIRPATGSYEPDGARVPRPVPRGPGGATPPGYSTRDWVSRPRRCPACPGGLAEALRQARLERPPDQDEARAVLPAAHQGGGPERARGRSSWDVRPAGLHPLLGAVPAGLLGDQAQDRG